MKIAVLGAGAIGSVVAGYLHKTGIDVLLVGRKEQVSAIQTKGLQIKGVRGNESFQLNVATKLNQEYDLVIFTVKTQDLEEIYQANNEFLDHGLILTSQNGVQADNVLSVHFDQERMISSIVMFGATYMKPGEVTFNFEGDWILGKPFRPNDPELETVAEILRKAFPVTLTTDIMGMKWLKLFVNFNNCIPALLGKSMQETFSDMDFCRLSVLLLKEGYGIVQNASIPLISLPNFPLERISGLAQMPVEQAAGIMNKTLTGLSKEPLYGSILQSIMRQKTSEIDYINGEVVLLGRHIRQSAPLNEKAVMMVHEVERSGRFFTAEEVKKEFNL